MVIEMNVLRWIYGVTIKKELELKENQKNTLIEEKMSVPFKMVRVQIQKT